MRGARRRLVGGAAAAAVLVASAVTVLAFRSGDVARDRIADGDRAPHFAATTIDDGHIDLATFRGRRLIITFGASWCEPCRKEFPLLQRARQRHPSLAIIGVDYQDSPSLMLQLMQRLRVHWPVANDAAGSIAADYGVDNLPETFFVSPAGIVVAHGFGLTTWEAVREPLQRLLES